MIDAREKIALFIDGPNFYATNRSLGISVDYLRFLEYWRSQAYLVRSYYYTTISENPEYNSVRPLVDWLSYNGFTVETKPARDYTDEDGRRRFRGTMDVNIAMTAMEMSPYYDHAILFTGNGELTPLVESLQRRGKRVTVVSTTKSNNSSVSDDLRRTADFFVDLSEIKSFIVRDEDAGGTANAAFLRRSTVAASAS